LWILPFMIMKIGYDRKYARVFLLQFLTFVIINLTMFSFYYTTSGTSVFFFPSYTPLLQGISNALFPVYNNPIFLGLRFDELLISVFAGVNIWILARLIWDRVSARVVRQFSRVAGN
jgi:hypothetical protein